MTLLMLAFTILLPALAGFLCVNYVLRSDPELAFVERLFLGFGIGTGLMTFEMFLLAWAGIPLSALIISLIQVASVVVFGYLAHGSGALSMRGSEPPFNIQGKQGIKSLSLGDYLRKAFFMLLVGWIVAKLLILSYESYVLPVHSFDSWAHWSSGAKFIFYEKGLALNPSSEHYFGAGYLKIQRYPLHVPLLQVWASLCLNEAHESYMKVWNLYYYISIIGLMYFSVRRESSPLSAILAAFFVSSAPLLTYHALVAYADLTLGYYALGSAICFRKYISSATGDNGHGSGGTLVLMGAFTAFSVWTKMEGLLFAFAWTLGLIVLIIRKKCWTDIFRYLVPVLAVAVPWYTFLLTTGASVSYGEAKDVGAAVSHGLHLEVLPVILKELMISANFNMIFPFLLVLCLLGGRIILRSDLKYLLVPMFMVFLLFLFLYLATASYKWVTTLTAIDRNILTFLPMVYYITALVAVKFAEQ
jgi:hypothetical protein